jgi:predicted Zn-dependent protease with MMP-like domain
MHRSDFEKLVEEAVLALPERIRDKVKNVAFVIEDFAKDEHYHEADADNHDDELLGLYVGIPLTERVPDDSGTLPDKIILFQESIEDEAEEFEDGDVALVVRDTVWHEIGHYFGLEEEAVRRLEEKWRTRE